MAQPENHHHHPTDISSPSHIYYDDDEEEEDEGVEQVEKIKTLLSAISLVSRNLPLPHHLLHNITCIYHHSPSCRRQQHHLDDEDEVPQKKNCYTYDIQANGTVHAALQNGHVYDGRTTPREDFHATRIQEKIMPPLMLREQHHLIAHEVVQLTWEEDAFLEHTGLWHVAHLTHIRANLALVTTVVERFHSETGSFHFSTWEATVTLEDVYRILRIRIDGERVDFDPARGEVDMVEVFCTDDLRIDDGEIRWADVLRLCNRIRWIVASLIGGFLCLDRRSRGLAVGWGIVLSGMFTHGVQYAWGTCVLGQLYRDMHHCVYRRGKSLSARVTLLQVWAWEHIPVIRPMTQCQRARGEPYSFL